MANHCTICGCKIGMLTGCMKLIDGNLCGKCYRPLPDSIREKIMNSQKNPTVSMADVEKAKKDSRPSYEVDGSMFKEEIKYGDIASIDTQNRIVMIRSFKSPTSFEEHYVSIDKILDCELIDEDYMDSSKGVKGAVIGGATGLLLGGTIWGATGTIVGNNMDKKNIQKVSQLGALLHFDDDNAPIFVKFVVEGFNKNTDIYRQYSNYTRSFVFKIKSMIQSETASEITSHDSIPDDIRKYKELLDDGIITQDEFDTKKKQLLGL